jgi:hypothetical protein
MRLQITITEMDEERWAYLQSNVHTDYNIPEGSSRVCLTFTHGEEERHAEMTIGAVVGLLVGLGLVGATSDLRRVLGKLKPTDLPSFLDQVRTEADPARGETPAGRRPILPTPEMVRGLTASQAKELTELVNRPCDDHGSPVITVESSQFQGAPPIRTHEDGCQSYGPYAEQKYEGDPSTFTPSAAERYRGTDKS